MLNLDTLEWIQLPDMLNAYSFHVCGLVTTAEGQEVVVVGSFDGFRDETNIYSIRDNEWRKVIDKHAG